MLSGVGGGGDQAQRIGGAGSRGHKGGGEAKRGSPCRDLKPRAWANGRAGGEQRSWPGAGDQCQEAGCGRPAACPAEGEGGTHEAKREDSRDEEEGRGRSTAAKRREEPQDTLAHRGPGSPSPEGTPQPSPLALRPVMSFVSYLCRSRGGFAVSYLSKKGPTPFATLQRFPPPWRPSAWSTWRPKSACPPPTRVNSGPWLPYVTVPPRSERASCARAPTANLAPLASLGEQNAETPERLSPEFLTSAGGAMLPHRRSYVQIWFLVARSDPPRSWRSAFVAVRRRAPI